MSGEVTKAVGALDRAARLVDETRQELDKRCTDLQNTLKNMGEMWGGAGASAFKQVYQQWEDETRRVIADLDRFQSNLQISEAAYTRTDEGAQAGFNKLASRLGPG